MSFPRYPKYKNSGVEWLGEVPEHWEVAPLKRCFTIVGGSTPASGDESLWDGDIPWATPSDLSSLKSVYIETTQRTITLRGLQSCGTTLVPAGTVILSTRAPIGSLGIAARELCTNQGCKSLVPNARAHPKYFAYLLSVSTEQLVVRGKGTTFLELSGAELGSFQVPVPAMDSQSLIASFLDRETAKIDALIAEQQRLIELLQEKRQAVISHAVTKGLNPDAPMKDSGNPGIGSMPKHWHVSKMKWVARMESGHTPDKKIEAYWEDCEIPWVSLNDTGYLRDHDYISDTAYRVNELGIANSSARLLPERVVVFSRDATIGRCAITTRPMAVSQHFIAWVCGERMLPEYLLFRLRTMTQELERLTTGATLKTIGMPDVRTLQTPVPPIEEQKVIVAHIQRSCNASEIFVSEAEKAITLLQERRSALISAAVTGQIDVRGLANSEAA